MKNKYFAPLKESDSPPLIFVVIVVAFLASALMTETAAKGTANRIQRECYQYWSQFKQVCDTLQ